MVVEVSLRGRAPFDPTWAIRFLAERAVPGVEVVDGAVYGRSLRLRHGPAIVRLEPRANAVAARIELADEDDRLEAIGACRRLLDIDADPVAIDRTLGADPVLAPLVAARPGQRAPGAVDTHEIAVRAVLGQQISVRAARTLATRLVERYGAPLPRPASGVTHLFPTAAAIATADVAELAMPKRRAEALIGLCEALAVEAVVLDPDGDPAEARLSLLALPGVGPWTAEYIVMRALGDRDAWPATDLGIRHALARLPGGANANPDGWRPYRSYAVHHLWASLGG